MKKKFLALLVCILMLFTTSMAMAAPVSAEGAPSSYTEGKNGEFYYPFAADGDWSSRLTLAKLDAASFVQSDMGNDTGMLELKPYAGMPAISNGVSGITMQANKLLTIRGSICYKNYDKLADNKCFISVYLTGLAGVKLYNDPECTDYAEDAAGGFVHVNATVDTNGDSMADGNWHNFELSFKTFGIQHSTGKYMDLTGAKVNLWFRPFAGSDFKANEAYFTSDYLTECGYTKDDESGEWIPSEDAVAPYADCLLDDFEGTFVSLPRDGAPLDNYYESSDGSFFYPFNAEGDWTNRLNIAKQAWASFKQTDGENNSGILELKPYAGMSPISSGISNIIMQADQNLKIRGKIRYANFKNLVAKQCFVDCYLVGLQGAPLYSDADCLTSAGEAAGGFVQATVKVDVSGASFGDGGWHTFEVSFPAKGAKHSTGKYVDLTGRTVNLWFRPYAGNAFTATTTYFTQAYLDACTQSGETPYADVLLDDFEGYFTSNTRSGGYYKDAQTLFYPFDTETTADTTSFVGKDANRSFMEEYLGKEGVVTLKNAVGDVTPPIWNVTVAEGKKLRVSGDIALINAADLNAQNINVNALLILNGGSANSPAGFYEDEACTTPCTSISGNAICHSATLYKGIGADGWVHFSKDFDTTTVYKSTIKRASSDSAKSDVYIKPWEVANIAVWFRVSNGSPENSSLTLGTTVFTEEHLTSCGYMLDGTAWVADPEKTQTTPYLQYALDNFSIQSVKDGEILPEDIKAVDMTADKTDIQLGDHVNILYDLENGLPEDNSRVFLLADGNIVMAGRTSNGAFSFDATRTLCGKTLTAMVIPKTGTVSGANSFSLNLGTVTGELHDLKAEADGECTLKWSYDVFGSTAASQIIASLYSKDGALLKCTVTPVAATANADGIVAEGTLTDEKAQSGKVMIWDSVSGLKPLAAPKEVKFTEIVDDPFAGDDEINVVFLGGSITCGEKAADAANNGYAGLTSKWLKETYGKNKTVNCYNAGISGTPSNYGLLRLNRDVISRNPDLVFVEFAVNDGNRDSRFDMESIVRSLAACDTNPYIVFLYTTNKTYATDPVYHKQVAELYNIPQISLKDALQTHLSGQDAKEAGYFADEVHPTEEGHKFYFETIRDALATGRYFVRPTVGETKLVAASGPINTTFLDPTNEAVKKSSGWESGSKNGRPYVSTIWEEETLEFEFDGSILAVEHALNAGSGQYQVYVDGALIGTGDPYYKGALWDQRVMGFHTFKLEPGHHTCKIQTIASTNENSTGSQVMLYYIITGEKQ